MKITLSRGFMTLLATARTNPACRQDILELRGRAGERHGHDLAPEEIELLDKLSAEALADLLDRNRMPDDLQITMPNGLQVAIEVAVAKGMTDELLQQRSAWATTMGLSLDDYERGVLDRIPEPQLRAVLSGCQGPRWSRLVTVVAVSGLSLGALLVWLTCQGSSIKSAFGEIKGTLGHVVDRFTEQSLRPASAASSETTRPATSTPSVASAPAAPAPHPPKRSE